MKKMGVTDIPCQNIKDDSLGVKNYIIGLENFVKKCPTPMSIALQGDWGTGKTSFLNAMLQDLEEINNITTIYFNTWQFSQFKMSDNLYTSFINSIVNKLKSKVKDVSKAEEITKTVLNITKSIFTQVIKSNVDIDLEKVKNDILQNEIEKMQAIENLKFKFAQLVKDVTNDGRLIIFIDDLDRLSPEVAVELLEVMKLFMDVPSCIFILAIDYEVVVSGVRKKFGKDMSEEKCRSFFDKIIQLPFRMPVESYQIYEMINDILCDHISDKFIKTIGEFVKNTLGANPRTFKRLANSFFLLEAVQESMNSEGELKLKEEKSALLFLSLAIEMYCQKVHSWLLECSDQENIKTLLGIGEEKADLESEEGRAQYIENNNLEPFENEEVWRKIQRVLPRVEVALVGIQKESVNELNENDMYDLFLKALGLSSITSVSVASDAQEKERAKAMRTTEISIIGERIMVKNPTEAIIATYEKLLNNYNGKLNEFIEKYPRILTFDNTKNDGFFRKKKELLFNSNEKVVYIGTSSSSADKLLFTKYLCDFLQIESGKVIWYDEKEEVFSN